MEEKRSIWWTVLGLVATGATGVGIGYWAANRDKPCACKAKLGEGPGKDGNGQKE